MSMTCSQRMNLWKVRFKEEIVLQKKNAWTVVGRGDDEALKTFAKSIGTTHTQMKAVLDNESITSKEIYLLDVTEGLDELQLTLMFLFLPDR